MISTGSATSDGLLMEVCGCFVCLWDSHWQPASVRRNVCAWPVLMKI